MRGGWILGGLSFAAALFLVAGTGTAIWAVNNYRAPGPATQDRTFIVARGQGVAEVAQQLALEGIITQPLVFRGAARVTKADRAIHAGEYLIPAYSSMEQIIAKMVAGDVVVRKVTVPEGRTSWQVMKLVEKAEGMTGEVKEVPDEGSLLPETYTYQLGDTREGMIDGMAAAMTATITELWPLREADLPVKTEKEALVLASIVEKETGKAEERKAVAGVFINRLRINMPLQSDPTVIYAMTSGLVQDEGQGPIGRRLRRTDLTFDSPFNTYKNAGLPPTPICNPGRASIEAVLHPEKHDYLYFVADGTGGHVFAKTLEEHNANVEKWREIRKQSGN
jgi:UPF0755 protein